jgi:hypothetical protein
MLAGLSAFRQRLWLGFHPLHRRGPSFGTLLARLASADTESRPELLQLRLGNARALSSLSVDACRVILDRAAHLRRRAT